jgi:hypothetical protein
MPFWWLDFLRGRRRSERLMRCAAVRFGAAVRIWGNTAMGARLHALLAAKDGTAYL